MKQDRVIGACVVECAQYPQVLGTLLGDRERKQFQSMGIRVRRRYARDMRFIHQDSVGETIGRIFLWSILGWGGGASPLRFVLDHPAHEVIGRRFVGIRADKKIGVGLARRHDPDAVAGENAIEHRR